jgi:Ca-activated chloride channel homolog
MPNRIENFYSLLGLPRSATQEEIRRAYLKAAKRLHPDLNLAPGETEMFMAAQQAYQVLSDPGRRSAYDASLPPEEDEAAINKRILVSRKSLTQLKEHQLVYLLLELEPSAEYIQTAGYVPLNLCLVLDNSTSMKGKKLETAKETAIQMIKKLKPQDIFSVVTFNDRAEVIIPSSRQTNPVKMENSIRHIQAGGGTEIFHGLKTALDEVLRYHSQKSINHIILLTDGRTYGDEQACYDLAREAASHNICLTGFGIGSGWNDIFLDQLATLTGGHSMLAPQPQDIERLLIEKFTSLSRTFAENVTISYTLEPGVNISSAFRLQPVTDLIHSESPLRLGPILQNWPFSILIEFIIQPQETNKDYLSLISGKLEITTNGLDLFIPPIPVNILLSIRETGELETPAPEIIKALSKLSLYHLQEKARAEVANGNYARATQHLQRLATRLLSQGERSLAKTVMFEIDNIESKKTYSEFGEKQIKYGTRALMPPEEIIQ